MGLNGGRNPIGMLSSVKGRLPATGPNNDRAGWEHGGVVYYASDKKPPADLINLNKTLLIRSFRQRGVVRVVQFAQI